jgi:hypothetical protein
MGVKKRVKIQGNLSYLQQLKTNKNLWKFSYFWRAEKM